MNVNKYKSTHENTAPTHSEDKYQISVKQTTNLPSVCVSVMQLHIKLSSPSHLFKPPLPLPHLSGPIQAWLQPEPPFLAFQAGLRAACPDGAPFSRASAQRRPLWQPAQHYGSKFPCITPHPRTNIIKHSRLGMQGGEMVTVLFRAKLKKLTSDIR